LVNNAGIMPLSFIEQGRTDEWDSMIDVNIKGVLYAIDSVYTHMMERGSGQIINISSVAGKRLIPGSSVYSGTKFAVGAISEGLRIESAGKLQVTCIFPGAFETELGASIKDESMLEYLATQAQYVNLAQPAEIIADAILYALEQKPGVAANEIVLRPTAQDF
jgi:NADP-dependent 3-hydroxy acid dehydrogenase YdfG